jgi:hypothetical protein
MEELLRKDQKGNFRKKQYFENKENKIHNHKTAWSTGMSCILVLVTQLLIVNYVEYHH